MKFYPYEKGGGKSFSHAEGGGAQQFWDSFYAVACSFSHIEAKEGRKKFPLRRGAQKVSGPRFSHCVAPSPSP